MRPIRPRPRDAHGVLRVPAPTLPVVAGALLAILVAACGPVGPSPSTSPSPSASGTPAQPSPSAEPTSTPGSAWTGLDWSAGVTPFEPNHGAIDDILPWRGGYVGVGWTDASPDASAPQGTFFSSSDALHWTATFQTTLPNGWYLSHLLPLGNGLLALSNQDGSSCPADVSPCPEPNLSPLLWQSQNGMTWTPIDSPSWVSAWRFGSVLKVASGPAGLVAIGQRSDQISSGPGGGGTQQLAIAHSVDGRTWQLLDLPAAFDHAIFHDLVAFSGGFVIVGRDGEPDVFSQIGDGELGVGAPAAWVSPDGVTWSAAQVDGTALAGGELRGVAAGAEGLFATGVDTDASVTSGIPQGWSSTDGHTWAQVGQGFPPNQSPWWTLVGDGTRMIALGVRSSTPAVLDLGAWTSMGGSTWTPLTLSGATAIPAGHCAAPPADSPWACWALVQAWVVPDGVVAAGTGAVPQELWFATATSP